MEKVSKEEYESLQALYETLPDLEFDIFGLVYNEVRGSSNIVKYSKSMFSLMSCS